MGGLFWAISTVIFSALEVIMPGLITIWLSLAALILTFISSYINNSIVEFFIFSVLSLIFILFTKPALQRYLQKRKNLKLKKISDIEIKIEKVINIETKRKEYEVKYKGVIWSGISEEEFEVNEIAKIKEFDGNKIILEKIKDREC